MSLSKTSALLISVLAVVGCSLNRPTELQQTQWKLARIGGEAGQLVEPKRCQMTVAVLSRPLRDEAVNSALWGVVDEQVIGPEARRVLQENGLRLGRITGDLPAAVDAVLKAPPPQKVDPARYVVPDGQATLIAVGSPLPQASLLLNEQGRAHGKDYTDVAGFFRMNARYEGSRGVALRFVPEIHHGPLRNTFGAAPTGGVSSPHQFTVRNGQQEDTLRDLAAELTLQPNEVAVLGCLPDRPRSLGAFLFTQAEENSDRLLQRVVLVWAARTQAGTGGSEGVPPDLSPVDPPRP